MSNHAENILKNLARLKWACRRGMLELDVLLGNFLEQVYPTLSPTKKQEFAELLECADPELFSWLIRNEKPIETRFIPIIEAIQSHARKQFSIKTL